MPYHKHLLTLTACCGALGLASVAHAGALDEVTSLAQTGDELHFIRPADLKRGRTVWIVLTNPTKEPIRAQLALGVKERANATVALVPQDEIVIAPGGSVSHKLTPQMIGPRQGIKYVDWQLTAGAETATGHASFAVTDPVGVTPGVSKGFIFGNAGVRGYWNLELKERLTRAATIVGAESMRTGSDWRKLEPQSGQYEWKGEDEVIALLDKYGAQAQYLLGYGGAPWATPEATLEKLKAENKLDDNWYYQPRLDAWRNWARTISSRYKGKVRYWEIWNEPDIGFWKGNAEEYVELLQSASQEIKAVDRNNLVLTGGFASMDHREHNRKLLELTMTEGKPYFDLMAYHRHGSFDSLQKQVDGQLIPLRQKLGVTQPLYFNETAMGRDYKREYDMAIELPKRLAYTWSRGAAGYHYFTIWTNKGNTSSANAYSMINWDFSPRPVWVAYNEMSRLLRGRQLERQLDLGQGRWGFVFRGQGDFTGKSANDYALLAWKEDDVLADAPLILSVGKRAKVRAVDLMGNSTPVPVSGGRVVFTVQSEPRYLVVENGDKTLQNQGMLIEAERAGTLVPGGTQTVSVRLHNPLDTPQTVRLQWQVPAPLQAQTPLTLERRLPAGGSETATLKVALPAQAGVKLTVREVMATYRVGDGALQARAAVPIALGKRIAAGDFAGRDADFVLEEAGDVVNTNDIDPATLHLTWKGVDDLSARVWLGRAGNALRMRFVVRDDVHRQPHAGVELWKGDSIQVGLAVPGQPGDFELGLSRSDEGRSVAYLWRVPNGFDEKTVLSRVQLDTSRADGTTIYDATLPYEAFGLSDAILRAGVRFSFVVNDLDEAGNKTREGFVQLSPGIAGGKDSSRFPAVVIE